MSAVAAFGLTSPVTQAAAPFAIGHPFKKGDVPAGQFAQIDVVGASVEPMNTWPDGSLRTAVICGTTSLQAGVTKQVNIVVRNIPQDAGTAMTAASIKAALTSAEAATPGVVLNLSFSGGTVGTTGVNYAALIAAGTLTPARTYISNRSMVECHYKIKIGNNLYSHCHIRMFADGRMCARIVVGCGYLDTTYRTNQTYYVSTFIGGVNQFNYGGALYSHSPLARWDAIAWIGTDPQVTPKHDTGYLIRTKMFPNYWRFGAPSTATLDWINANKTYSPGENIQWSVNMADYGYQEQIGILPRWDAQYFTTEAHPSSYQAVIAHARAINSYAHAFPDTTSLEAFKLDDYLYYSGYGDHQGAMQSLGTRKGDGTTQLNWEGNHHGLPAYLAAMLTGEFYYHETLQNAARMGYLSSQYTEGLGVNRRLNGQYLQNRGRAWMQRTIGAACAALPSRLNSDFGEIKTWYTNVVNTFDSQYADVDSYPSGFIGMEDLFGNRLAQSQTGRTDSASPSGTLCAGTAFWEHDFNAQSWSWVSDLEPINDVTTAKQRKFTTYLHRNAVMRAGGDSSTEFNVAFAAPYACNFRVNTVVSADFTPEPHATWVATDPGQVFTDTYSTSSTDIKVNGPQSSLQGTSASYPALSTGYWANYLPALSYAVDQNATGAAAGWARLIGKDNWSMQVGADYDNTAQFGIVPVSYAQQPLQFTATDSGTGVIMPTPGPSIRVGALPLWTDGFIVTKQPGIGTPGSQIAGTVTGADGTTPIRDAIVAAGGSFNPLSEYRAVPSAGAHGTLFIDDTDLSQIYTGDGSYDTIPMAYYEDGVQFSSQPQYFGTAPAGSTVSGVVVSPATAVGSTTFTAVVNGTGSPSQAVTWSRSGTAGSINASTGVFIAPAATNVQQVITITATSVQDGTKAGTATVTIAALPVSTVTSVVVSPASGTIASGGLRTFTAVVNGNNTPSQGVTWATNLGTINPSTGQLTAPAATNVAQTGTVTATSTQDSTKAGIATFTVAAVTAPPQPGVSVTSVTVTPSGGTLVNGATRQYSAAVVGNNGPSQGVMWACNLGSIDAAGLYTPPAATYLTRLATITATSAFDPTKQGISTVTIAPLSTPIVVADNNMLRLDADGNVANTGADTFIQRGRDFWINKDPDAKLGYGIDLTDYLTRAGQGLTLTSATAKIEGMTPISDVRLQGNTIVVQLADGQSQLVDLNAINQCTFHFTLSNGDEDERSINFAIVNN